MNAHSRKAAWLSFSRFFESSSLYLIIYRAKGAPV